MKKTKTVEFKCDNEGWSSDEDSKYYLNLFLTNLSHSNIWKDLGRIANERWIVKIAPVARQK